MLRELHPPCGDGGISSDGDDRLNRTRLQFLSRHDGRANRGVIPAEDLIVHA
jgi:hypothetical protein